MKAKIVYLRKLLAESIRPQIWVIILCSGQVLSGCDLGFSSPTTAVTATATPTSFALTSTPITSHQTSIPSSLVGLPVIADLVDRVKSSVVSIHSSGVQQTFLGPRDSTSSGSGVVFREDGYILTNNHVVEGVVDIRVTFSNGRSLDAKIVGTDAEDDLAVIKVKTTGLQALPMGNINDARVGDWVIAMGNAVGLGREPTVTIGIISALERSLTIDNVLYNDLIQTDASINPGNSGGPLITLGGEVIGINSVVLRSQSYEGLGFAISSATASMAAEQLIAHGKVTWPRIGVFISSAPQFFDANGKDIIEGVLVTETIGGGPADLAGIEADDLIVAIDGQPTPNGTALQRVLRGEHRAGDEVAVTVKRGDVTKEIRLRLASTTSE